MHAQQATTADTGAGPNTSRPREGVVLSGGKAMRRAIAGCSESASPVSPSVLVPISPTGTVIVTPSWSSDGGTHAEERAGRTAYQGHDQHRRAGFRLEPDLRSIARETEAAQDPAWSIQRRDRGSDVAKLPSAHLTEPQVVLAVAVRQECHESSIGRDIGAHSALQKVEGNGNDEQNANKDGSSGARPGPGGGSMRR